VVEKLKLAPNKTGRIMPVKDPKKRRYKLHRLAGVEFKHNGLQHSFASHHVKVHRNATECNSSWDRRLARCYLITTLRWTPGWRTARLFLRSSLACTDCFDQQALDIEDHGEEQRKLLKAVGEFGTYISANRTFIAGTPLPRSIPHSRHLCGFFRVRSESLVPT
jgi:hypothetical protein